MDEKAQTRDILLVREEGDRGLKVVTGQHEDGTPQTTLPSVENNSGFLRIDREVLEDFFTGFLNRVKEPERFTFFQAPENMMESTVYLLEEIMSHPRRGNPEDNVFYRYHALSPPAYFNGGKQEQTPQNGQKQHQNGEVRIASGEPFRIPKMLFGVKLQDRQQHVLKSGQTLYVEGMKEQAGRAFNAYVKVNAEQGRLEFFDRHPDRAKAQAAVAERQEAKRETQKQSRGCKM
jgi:hypothetical protein